MQQRNSANGASSEPMQFEQRDPPTTTLANAAQKQPATAKSVVVAVADTRAALATTMAACRLGHNESYSKFKGKFYNGDHSKDNFRKESE
ncbi:unnamed protein product [Ceratitis capitata]|uniref:(Mediterranean fruit fly) hypothetical protein n=1 Tax=Ceratitis capitata TaxID=7213 RepID=A0A811UI54_CERCA|nr:unnamed protein product [Ceratitis capitata]